MEANVSIEPGLKGLATVLVVLSLRSRDVNGLSLSEMVLEVAKIRLRVANWVHERQDIVVRANHLLKEEPTGKSHDRLEDAVVQVPTEHSKATVDELMREVEHALRSEV